MDWILTGRNGFKPKTYHYGYKEGHLPWWIHSGLHIKAACNIARRFVRLPSQCFIKTIYKFTHTFHWSHLIYTWKSYYFCNSINGILSNIFYTDSNFPLWSSSSGIIWKPAVNFHLCTSFCERQSVTSIDISSGPLIICNFSLLCLHPSPAPVQPSPTGRKGLKIKQSLLVSSRTVTFSFLHICSPVMNHYWMSST